MRVRTKLADLEFRFGEFEYRRDHLIIHSAADQSMPTRVYVSPDDIVAALCAALRRPMVWLYLLAFPYFLIRYRRRRAQAGTGGGAPTET